jgi:hypothetical protein
MSGERLSRTSRDALLVVALANGDKQVDAAAKARMSSRTVHRRLQDPMFRQRVRDARDALIGEGSGLAAHYYRAAVETLVELANKGSEPVRLRAATQLIEIGERAVGDNLEARIALVETRIAGADLEDGTATT